MGDAVDGGAIVAGELPDVPGAEGSGGGPAEEDLSGIDSAGGTDCSFGEAPLDDGAAGEGGAAVSRFGNGNGGADVSNAGPVEVSLDGDAPLGLASAPLDDDAARSPGGFDFSSIAGCGSDLSSPLATGLPLNFASTMSRKLPTGVPGLVWPVTTKRIAIAAHAKSVIAAARSSPRFFGGSRR
jgi:hypothetical protein